MNFTETFEKYVKGQKIQGEVTIRDGYTDTEGVILENGYKYTSHGGGCSGEDCNSTYIFSPTDELIANNNW
jgi:hypothetical protein